MGGKSEKMRGWAKKEGENVGIDGLFVKFVKYSIGDVFATVAGLKQFLISELLRLIPGLMPFGSCCYTTQNLYGL